MTSPSLSDVFAQYQRTVPPVVEYFQRQSGQRVHKGIYSATVVLWLMIVQRLQSAGSLTSVVQLLAQGVADPLLPRCKRVLQRRISLRTGGYCQARQKISKEVVRRVNEEMVEQLREQLSEPWPGLGQPVYVIDGSSLRLAHCRELVRAFPPAENQHGVAHWPIMRMVVLHDLGCGLALRPCWGPMYGPGAVSEQTLAETALDALPAGAVVMGDRNFGVCSTAVAAQQRRLGVVVRLTQVRARTLVGPISQPGEYAVVWKPSRWDRQKHPQWGPETAVAGRLIAWRIGRGKSQQWLYLFTTIGLDAAAVVSLYAQRWTIETDLRSLKRTVRIQHLTAKSLDMMEKELLVAVVAYNLVRAVMCMAARQANLDPRQLSFTQVLHVVTAAWPRLLAAGSNEEHHREFQRVLDYAASCTLPRRRRPRSYPRAVWRHRNSFPANHMRKTK
jgi:hypothetical protein